MDILGEIKSLHLSLEESLDCICNKYGFLLHGSIHKTDGNKIISKNGKVFASNKAAIVIMRSLYSNEGVNLQYPYFITKEKPFILEIHAKASGKYIKKDTGYVYVLKNEGFKKDPEGSWQFVKEANEVEFVAVIETKSSDFTYPLKIFNDFNI